MTTIITPDNIPSTSPFAPVLFLAGSIEQGKATNWQQKAIEFYSAQQEISDLTIVNPRREVWPSELEQSIQNAEFYFQVSFELQHLEGADAVIMWLEPGTMSPISLFEFGLLTGWASMGALNKLVIGCPNGFWRKGNVEVVTNRYRIQLVDTFSDLLEEGYTMLQRNHERRNTITADLKRIR